MAENSPECPDYNSLIRTHNRSSGAGSGLPGSFPERRALTTAQQAHFDLGEVLYAGICAACHQPHGPGMEGLAPPLIDSEWGLGSEQRIARIILHGVSGPLKVHGRTYKLDMPALGLFNEEQVASLLTYIRREWEHAPTPVAPETVKAIRSENHNRTEAWRQDAKDPVSQPTSIHEEDTTPF